MSCVRPMSRMSHRYFYWMRHYVRMAPRNASFIPAKVIAVFVLFCFFLFLGGGDVSFFVTYTVDILLTSETIMKLNTWKCTFKLTGMLSSE